ncbi:TPA: hypothetical protein DD449_00035 [Candidatus Berkelbacteria bacterium]|uniref:Mannosyl-glycoprotein endo-beta-N-acetylglucosamidase-like domain-containing protein n=1 Tax=Berkelbacteria bacterium GW2011_GWE1_39_12 TaxID=1618337 RepID=A0A0G4B737_9BACT|nr:MAG: hypothetical protein UT28_C0001G1033 [Berkelbacteria bacterium GW2011_GWE1_39_12]HBO60064.1 hypothetical protein [Candidatus Berkelbacteria bacterium]
MTIKKILTISLSVAAIFLASTAIAQAKSNKPESNIVFDKGASQMLKIEPQKTEIIIGVSEADMKDFNENPTPEKIKAFMQSIAPEYSVDWKLVYAIGYHESGNYGSSLAERNHNYFGRKAKSGGWASWSTPEEGIRDQFDYIKRVYFSRGLDTPAKINPIYCVGDTWHLRVESVMASL